MDDACFLSLSLVCPFLPLSNGLVVLLALARLPSLIVDSTVVHQTRTSDLVWRTFCIFRPFDCRPGFVQEVTVQRCGVRTIREWQKWQLL